MNLVSDLGDRGRIAASGSALIALALIGLLALTGRAQAAETIFWDNYDASPESISFADITGSGGGALNLAPAELDNPEGMAYDTVTNRLFVTSEFGPTGQVLSVGLDGSGAVPVSAPGAVFAGPEGVTFDPVNRVIYWVNTEGTGSIGWAKIDGSAGGLLNTAGATVSGPYRIALDPVAGRVYWANTTPNPDSISFANVNNSGGGDLDLTGATPPSGVSGLAVDPAGGRIYWLNGSANRLSFASLAGGGGGEVNLAGAVMDEPYGLAFDPSIGKFYWGNYGKTEDRLGAIGFVHLAGGGGGITPATAPLDGPQDPVIIKSPTGTGAPTVTRDPKARSSLTCPTGTWGADYPGSFVYQAPRSFAYQWLLNGAPIGGGTAATFIASSPGDYTCTVTAANHTGSAIQTSAAIKVKPSKVKLTTKKKAKADPGDLVAFAVKIVNQGDLQSKKARICVKLPKAAKDDLRKPKCKKLAKLNGQAKRTTKFRVKVKPGADEGTDKLTFQVKGTPSKAAKSKIVVR